MRAVPQYPDGAADLGDVGSVFDRYQGAPRRFLALDIDSSMDSRFTGDWQTILAGAMTEAAGKVYSVSGHPPHVDFR